MSVWFRRNGFMALAYLLIATSGVCSIALPSPSLSKQGGFYIALAWAVFAGGGGLIGLIGIITRKAVLDVTGACACASACLVWCGAVVLQAVSTGSATAITAACLAGAIAALFARRWVDAMQSPTE